MADTGDAATPSGGRGRTKKAADTAPTETADPTQPTEPTLPGVLAPEGSPPPARRRWSVPFLLFPAQGDDDQPTSPSVPSTPPTTTRP